MRLGPSTFLGDTDREWDVGGVRVMLTRYSGLETQKRHCHEMANFFYLLDGEFVDESDELGAVVPGRYELLYHPAGAWHGGISGPVGRVGLNIEPSLEWMERWGVEEGDFGRYRVERHPGRLVELLRLIGCGFEEEGDALLEVLLGDCEAEGEESVLLGRVREVLEERGEHWTLSSLAKELGVHSVYLARVFRGRYGCSVTSYFQQRRVLEGAKLLREGEEIAVVAYGMGFADQSHFGRVFKSYVKCTPKEFVRRSRLGLF